MRYKGLDLNLLATFDTLMRERSVSASARVLNLSQPAVSAALARLREFFGDQLLVPQGRTMHPSPFAEALAPTIRDLLEQAEILLATSARFDPATTQRTFRIITSDYMIDCLIAPLVERMVDEAPGVRLELASASEAGEAEIAEGRADLFIAPDSFMRGNHPNELLFEENHVIVGWRDNPLFKRPIDKRHLLAAGHVGVRIGASRLPAFADRQMSSMGLDRRIEVETSTFLSIPSLLEGTNRLALMQLRLARRMSKVYPLVFQSLPFAFPPMRESMQFHRARASDEGLAWLRQSLQNLALTDP